MCNYIVVYLRLLTSAQLQKKEEFFENFLEGGQTMKDFCSQVSFGARTSCNKPAADLQQCCSNNLSTGCVRTACSQLVDNLLQGC